MSAPVPEFIDLVRDALLHLYDVGYLHAHLLLGVQDPDAGEPASGRRLRQALLDAIETLRPSDDVAPTARVWRTHHILELRYIECHNVADVMEQVALSSAQYHREHHRALEMVAFVLWERWQAATRWPVAAERAVAEPADPIWSEAEGLVHDRPGGQVDAAGILHDVGLLLQPLAIGRAVDLRVALPERLPAIAGERVAVRQLVLALLAHAVEAVERATIEVRLTAGPSVVVLTIAGPATGDTDEIERGLAASRPFVQALGGTLAYAPADAAAGWAIRVGLPAVERPALLVVDNTADFLRLVERYLSGSGWEVLAADSVDAAVGLARSHRPDLILLDVIIPGRDGWDLLLELQADPTLATIPVVICSVLHEPQMATALGAKGYLQKPVSREALVGTLSKYGARASVETANGVAGRG